MVTCFGSHRPTPKNNNNLFSLKQEEGETFRSYVAYFNIATLEVKNLNEFITMSTLKRGLQNDCLAFSLDKNFSRSYTELLECVAIGGGIKGRKWKEVVLQGRNSLSIKSHQTHEEPLIILPVD